VLKKVTHGILINFLKEDPTTYGDIPIKRKNELYKVEIERFNLDKDNKLKRLDCLSLGKI